MVKFKNKELFVLFDLNMKRFNNSKALKFDIDETIEESGLFAE